MSPDRRDGGFALLEVLIAFAIAAFALSALYGGVLTGMRGAGTAARTEEALSHARSHLGALGHGQDLVAGETSGDDGGGFHYRLRIEPIARIAPQGTATLYAVEVTMTWNDGGTIRQLSLTSQRLGPSGGDR